MKKTVLGIKIDDVSLDQAANTVAGWLNEPGPASPRGEKHYIVTPNPEIIVMAQKDKVLKDILNKADLSIPDGVGLTLTTDIVCHTSGIDLMEELIKASEDYGFTIGLLGGKVGVAEKTAKCLLKKHPKLKISFAESGGEVDEEGNILRPSEASGEVTSKTIIVSKESSRLRSNNNISPTDLLFVAFGPPKQEKWIGNNLHKIPVKVAMVVGGSFDYISGVVTRAPVWVRKIGLEWFFRLLVQPWRLGRQVSLIKFVFYILRGTK